MKKILLFLILLFFPGFSLAANLEVPAQYSSISLAIKKALPGDVILVSAGNYNERLWIEKNIEIKSVSGYENTVINAGDGGSAVVFYNTRFNGTLSAKISGFTIRDGYSDEGQGGGITLAYADAIVENNYITSNRAKVDGGGILVSLNSTGIIRNNKIQSNDCGRFGAGIAVFNDSHPLIYGNDFSGNNASGEKHSNWGAGGGGIFVDGNSSPQIIKNTFFNNRADHAGGGVALRAGCSSIIEDNTFGGNTASYGGGLHIETEGGSPTVRNNIIADNQANYSGDFSGSGFGGGISIYNNSKPLISGNSIYNNFATQGGGGIVSSEGADSIVRGNKIYGNKITTSSGNYEGGGIYVAASTMTINNNLIYKNEGRIGGGIALLDYSSATVQNNTIIKNKAPYDQGRPSGGGIFVRNTVSNVSVSNNIITQNEDFQIFEENKKASIQFNLLKNDNRGMYYNWDCGEIHDIENLNSSGSINADYNTSGDEKFTNSDGDDYRLISGSEAINRGGSSIIFPYDIDYHFRSGTPDIGAYEYITETKFTSPVYRFWSDVGKHHFYTISKDERDFVLANYEQKAWKYEGESFRAYKNDKCVGSPVYRFWSDTYRGHFYTIEEWEKNHVIDAYDDSVWRYEGEAYCAETNKKNNSTELYRFWSDTYRGHFYTTSEGEKNYVIDAYDDSVWRYESVGYFVYPN